MDVKTLCLGLLAEGDACGYDLKKEFEALFKHFFPAGYGSIYPALADLAADGLVECELIPQQSKPDRKVYRITEAGRRRFSQALQNSKPRHKLRSEFLATVYFASMMQPERLAFLLQERVTDLRGTLEHIHRIESGWNDETPAGERFVAGFGAAVAKAAADYIEQHGEALLEQSRPSEQRRARAQSSGVATLENRA